MNGHNGSSHKSNTTTTNNTNTNTFLAFPPRYGVFVPNRILIPWIGTMLVLIVLQSKTLLDVVFYTTNYYTGKNHRSIQIQQQQLGYINTINGMKGIHHDIDQCRWYLAESAIPHGGMGVFTAIGLHKDDIVGFPDICIFVSDAPDHWTHLRGHSFGGGSFFGQYEGYNNRAACEGFTTNYNTVPDAMVNTEMVSPVLPTHAGTHRSNSPGAGAITHHFGIHGKAKDVILAGSELTINYGDWDFDNDKEYVKPIRDVSWLQKFGWCIDNIEIGLSQIPDAGRGAFARVPLTKDTVIAPVPLQSFRNRKVFQKTKPEQLYVNYCLQPKGSRMLFYPYGAAVNLINHSRYAPNVKLQWSSNRLHHSAWLDLPYDEFWKVVSPGGLIMEVVALRDIAMGEELLLDYGPSWEEAWNKHVEQWKPPKDAQLYVYPVEMDETEPLRTMKEQETNPYPSNLGTMCQISDWDREDGPHVRWEEDTEVAWQQYMTYCHILERYMDKATGNYLYTVSPVFSWDPAKLKFNPRIADEKRLMDRDVPRRAIRFMELPYMDDEHLQNAFRHPIEMPAHLVSDAWKD